MSRSRQRWPDWCDAIRDKVVAGDRDRFVAAFFADCRGKTAAVFGDGLGFGWLPHPLASDQEQVVQLAGIDGEVAACVLAATSKGGAPRTGDTSVVI